MAGFESSCPYGLTESDLGRLLNDDLVEKFHAWILDTELPLHDCKGSFFLPNGERVETQCAGDPHGTVYDIEYVVEFLQGKSS